MRESIEEDDDKGTEKDNEDSGEAQEIRMLGVSLTLVVLMIGISMDVWRDEEEFSSSVRLKLSAMLLASCWTGPLSIVAGLYAYPNKWRVVQPFAGGGGFVVVQAVGWLLYALSLFVLVVACLNAGALEQFGPAMPRGAYASLGSFCAAAQLTLNLSVGLFESDKSSASTLIKGQGAMRTVSAGQRRRPALTALSVMLTVAGQLLLMAADQIFRSAACGLFFPELDARCQQLGMSAASVLVLSGVSSHGLASLATHAVHGKIANGPQYKLWMPFTGGPRFVLLQALAWTLWGIVTDILVAIAAPQVARIPGAPTATGFCCLVANVVLLLSLDYFSSKPDTNKEKSVRHPAWGPERVVAALFVLLALLAFLTGAWCPLRWSRRSRAPAAYGMATVLCHLASPLAHFGGARTIRGYHVFMVGAGGPRFIIAQGCAWMLYAFSLLASILLVVNGDKAVALVRGAPPLGVLSSGLVVVSVGLFESNGTDSDDIDPTKDKAIFKTNQSEKNEERRVELCSFWRNLEKAPRQNDVALCLAAANTALADIEMLLNQEIRSPQVAALLYDARHMLIAERLSAENDFENELEEVTQQQPSPQPPLVLARALASPKETWSLQTAAQLFAAPLASLAGLALFAGAELVFRKMDDSSFTPHEKNSRGVLSPVLAMCAFTATLASGPLQVQLDRRLSHKRHQQKRFVALRLVGLAAWSFAVLAALAALLRYLGCSGCALARSIGRTVLRSPLGAIGWAGIVVQLLVLVFAPPADSLAAAVGQLESNDKEDSKKKQRISNTQKVMPFSSTTKPAQNKRNQNNGILLSSGLPEDAWRLVEASLTFAELGVLAAVAKNSHWCAVYTRSARWRRLFATRGCGRQVPSSEQTRRRQWSEPTLPQLPQWQALWRGIEVSLSTDQGEIDTFFEHRSVTLEGPEALRRRVHNALADRSTPACAWKLACLLHERGAPLARCGICAHVDIGDDFVTPCAHCPGETFHRACLEKSLPTVPRCTSCGNALQLTTRNPLGPIELSKALSTDRVRLLGTAGRCVAKWTFGLAVITAIDSSGRQRKDSSYSAHPALAWFLLQQILLLELFFSRRFATVVDRLWSTASRNAIRFYLRLYLYFIIASAGILLSFSNLGALFHSSRQRQDISSLSKVSIFLRLIAWTNLILYALVSSSCLYLFVRTSYLLPTVADYHHQAPTSSNDFAAPPVL